ncbi:MAG TPA: O-methyltransferase [Verrucomicrobiae bacterium]|nr:O-methyltransferase [Verrucomicrobiae bacterium]
MSSKIDNNLKIISVLNKLNKQSQFERSNENDIKYNDLMLSITEDTGMFLDNLITIMNVKKILEIGTSVGYSTLWFAHALYNKFNSEEDKFHIVSIENNPDKIKRAQNNFIEAGVNKIKIMEGNALDVLQKISHEKNIDKNYNEEDLFDFIFLDADKENLTKYFDIILPMLRRGGVIITDNILYPEDYRPYMSKYVEYIRNNTSVMSVTVPIGYGEEMTVKKY